MNKPQTPNPKSQTPLVIGHWSLVIVCLALLILLLPAVQPLLTTDFSCGYDNGFHLWRAVQVASCLRQGYLYPRWAPDMAHGYGFPLFIFHPPLTAYFAASLNLLGVSWPLAINATFVLGMLLAGAFAFIFARELFGPAAGLVAAVAYVFSPFQAYDVFNRGSLSESFAWVFPPLILWAVHRWSVRGERRFLPLAALSLAGFILTHNLFAFLFAPLLVVWVLADGYLARDWRVIGRGALAGLLGLGLCTFFWLPGLAERGWVQTDRLLGTWVFEYHNNFLDVRQLLAPPRATDPSLVNDWPPKALGLFPALIALLPLARWRQLNRQTRWRVALLLASTAGFAFLTLPASRPLWDRLPLLPYIQFPWRFLGPAAFSAAVLAGISVSNRSTERVSTELDEVSRRSLKSQISNLKSQNLQTSILIILLVLGSLGWFYPGHCAPPEDTSITGMLAWERATHTLGTTAKGEYLPIWVHRMPQDPEMDAASEAGGAAYAAGRPIVRLSPESLPQGARVLRADYGPVDATIVLESPVPFRARYLAFYYPGWRVTVDGDPVPATPADPDGLLSFSVPAGTHTVRVRFGETPLRLAADAISVLSLAILIITQIPNLQSPISNLQSPFSILHSPFPILHSPFAVQHHHAHIASCLADNSWSPDDGPVIGVAWDGTGYGTDGNIWGGEFLVADYHGFRRVAQLEYMPMPGGEAAIRNPYRLAIGYLYALTGQLPTDVCHPPLEASVDGEELRIIQRQIDRGINCPRTSAGGRLFDAVSALLGIRERATYEAQAAIELEMAAQMPNAKSQIPNPKSPVSNLQSPISRLAYPFDVEKTVNGGGGVEDGGVAVIRLRKLFEALLADRQGGVSVGEMAYRFHATVAEMMRATCERIARETGLRTVALSGGCFQNRLLLTLVVPRLQEMGLRVIMHRRVPCNDGGVSLGQAVIAHFAVEHGMNAGDSE